MIGVLMDPTLISFFERNEHFHNCLQSYILLDILYPTSIVLILKFFFQFHEYNITIPNISKFGFHGGEDNALSCGGILAFWIMDVSHIIHSINERASKICDRTSSFSALLRIVLTIRYQS